MVGFIAMCTSIFAALYMVSYKHWRIDYEQIHTWAGFYTFLIFTGMLVSGLTAGTVRLMCDCKWKTNYVLNIGAFHKYYAYTTILLTQAVLFSGFLCYTTQRDGADASLHLGLAISNCVGFFALLLVCELCHQRFTRGPAVSFDLPE